MYANNLRPGDTLYIIWKEQCVGHSYGIDQVIEVSSGVYGNVTNVKCQSIIPIFKSFPHEHGWALVNKINLDKLEGPIDIIRFTTNFEAFNKYLEENNENFWERDKL